MDISITAYQMILGVDVIIIVLLLVILYRNGKTREGHGSIDVLKIRALKSTLDQAVGDSQRTTQGLVDVLGLHINDLQGILRVIETKERKLEECIAKADDLIDLLKKQGNRQNKAADPYTRAAELIAIGITADDIRKQCGLSLNEIDLIRQLERNRAQ